MSGQNAGANGTLKVPFTFTLSGVLLVIAGLVGLANPFAATMSATMFFAWILIFAGIFGLVGAFSFDGWGSKLIGILLGLVTAAAGFFALANPVSASITLTIVVISWLTVRGIIELVMAFSAPAHKGWMFAMAALDLLLAFLLYRSGVAGATAAVGFYVAISLLFWGVWNLVVSYQVRKAGDAIASELNS